MEDKKLLKKAKNINTSLKTDSNSVLFFKEKWGKRLLTKLKKSKDMKHSLLLELILLADNILDDEEKVLTRIDYDVANLEYLGKNATIPRYVLLVVDLYSSKV